MQTPLPLRRWWIYQQERFPIFKHGLLIAVFSGAAVGYGARLIGTDPTPAAAGVAFISTFCMFLQMRIADEFKDFEDDAQYRPYRPVPRGLISLGELAGIGIFCGVVQLVLAIWLAPPLVALLLGLWAYFGLMCKEFFVRDWLKAHPVAYVFSHMVIVPLISLYAVACQTLPTGSLPLPLLWPFLLACFCNGWVIELGRKIRFPQAEEPGVETYSALWGLQPAVRLWLGMVGLTAIFAGWAAVSIQATAWVVPILAGLGGFMLWRGLKVPLFKGDTGRSIANNSQPEAFSRRSPPAPLEEGGRSDLKDPLDMPTALWTLGVYLSLGWLPTLLLR